MTNYVVTVKMIQYYYVPVNSPSKEEAQNKVLHLLDNPLFENENTPDDIAWETCEIGTFEEVGFECHEACIH